MRSQKAPGDARDAYQNAMEIQETLVQRDPNNLPLISNLAATYTHWGMLEKDAGSLDAALAKIEQGVGLDEQLVKADPSNPQWETFLTPNYVVLSEILEKMNRPEDALVHYQKTFDARRDLATWSPDNVSLARQFAEAAKSLGDHSKALDQIEAYRAAVQTWKKLLENPKASGTAAAHFDDVFGFAKAFHDAKDWPDEQAAFTLAGKMARWNFEKDPSDTKWKDRADAAAVAAEAANDIATPPSSAPE